MEKLPSTSSSSSVLRWSANARKFGSEGLASNKLYKRLRPVDARVEFSWASIVDRDVNPRPTTPFAPYCRAGFSAELTSRKAWEGIDILGRGGGYDKLAENINEH
jgi:hypothetical protein